MNAPKKNAVAVDQPSLVKPEQKFATPSPTSSPLTALPPSDLNAANAMVARGEVDTLDAAIAALYPERRTAVARVVAEFIPLEKSLRKEERAAKAALQKITEDIQKRRAKAVSIVNTFEQLRLAREALREAVKLLSAHQSRVGAKLTAFKTAIDRRTADIARGLVLPVRSVLLEEALVSAGLVIMLDAADRALATKQAEFTAAEKKYDLYAAEHATELESVERPKS